MFTDLHYASSAFHSLLTSLLASTTLSERAVCFSKHLTRYLLLILCHQCLRGPSFSFPYPSHMFWVPVSFLFFLIVSETLRRRENVDVNVLDHLVVELTNPQV